MKRRLRYNGSGWLLLLAFLIFLPLGLILLYINTRMEDEAVRDFAAHDLSNAAAPKAPPKPPVETVTCSACNGSGVQGRRICPSCGGDGRMPC